MNKNNLASKKQLEYIKKYKRNSIINIIIQYSIIIIFLIVWEISANQNYIDPFFFSSPSRIIKQLYILYKDNVILNHILITLLEIIISFFIVTFISLLFSTLMWYFQRLSTIIEPYLIILNSLPKSALAPLLIVWLGTGMNTIIVAGISVCIFGSIISIYSGFKNTDSTMLQLITTLGGKKLNQLFLVVLPSSLPIIISTSKVNIGLSLVGVIIGEFLASRQGLGYLIIYGTQVFKLDLVITSIIVLCIIAILLYIIISKIEKSLQE